MHMVMNFKWHHKTLSNHYYDPNHPNNKGQAIYIAQTKGGKNKCKEKSHGAQSLTCYNKTYGE